MTGPQRNDSGPLGLLNEGTDLSAGAHAGEKGANRSYRTVGAVLRDSATAYGAAPFVTSGELELSFAELDSAVDRAASGLLSIGVGRGDHVGLWLGNSVEWVVWFCACARIGAAIVPVSTRYKADEMGYVVAHSACKALIISGPRWGIDFLADAYRHRPRACGPGSGTIAPGAISAAPSCAPRRVEWG